MRLYIFLAMLFFGSGAGAQSYLQSPYHPAIMAPALRNSDSMSSKKWSLTKYASVSAGAMFFKGGSASFLSAPVGVQLNRRLTNNLYAFADVAVAPTYLNSGSTFRSPGFLKTGTNVYQPSVFGMYSRAALGLQYVNDDRTFSISGSIGVSRGSYPYYQMPFSPAISPE